MPSAVAPAVTASAPASVRTFMLGVISLALLFTAFDMAELGHIGGAGASAPRARGVTRNVDCTATGSTQSNVFPEEGAAFSGARSGARSGIVEPLYRYFNSWRAAAGAFCCYIPPPQSPLLEHKVTRPLEHKVTEWQRPMGTLNASSAEAATTARQCRRSSIELDRYDLVTSEVGTDNWVETAGVKYCHAHGSNNGNWVPPRSVHQLAAAGYNGCYTVIPADMPVSKQVAVCKVVCDGSRRCLGFTFYAPYNRSAHCCFRQGVSTLSNKPLCEGVDGGCDQTRCYERR